MFATLIGTDTEATQHRRLSEQLVAIATQRGFLPPGSELHARPDQGSLDGWSLELRGPRDEDADFLLAVTAPKMPGISPIHPVLKTVAGPLFAVVVLNSVFVVSRADQGDVTEFKDVALVHSAFQEFLDGIAKE